MAGPELTPDVSGNPRVEVFFDPDELDPATVRLRMYRFSDNRTWLVRGGVDVAPGVAALDWECPFQTEVTYRAEMFNAAGASLGFSDFSSITLDVDDVWVHNPLVPSGAVNLGPLGLLGLTASRNTRPTVGGVEFTEGSSVGTLVSGSRRRGIVDMPFGFAVESVEQAGMLQDMLGHYDAPQLSVLCIRTPPPAMFPRTFFAAVREPDVQDVNVAWGGDRSNLLFTAIEVKPPFPGLAAPLLTYDDLDAFGDYDVQDANWPTTTDRDRAYELAGLAG